MKRIVFKWNRGFNDQVTEIVEFYDDATEEEINEQFADWVYEQVSDNVTWYEADEGENEK
ncbi:hypothetical protein ABE068_00945 [Bacillus glycinifermentans]|uniref:Uncharacterized protein n=1 Tax=Bacillus glycinifermentans TaxID=1664069 RepID=A0A0T6BR15_9BACI|nr:hypothetical protein [Bacillus glycinifermentans]KRT94085.1 hypothetical protein AB447_215735 [Bacillus glycinifermentans]MEC0487481.1 hypothetical protein [Bacillus glycinifermentans]